MEPTDKENFLFTVHCAVDHKNVPSPTVEGFFLPSNRHAILRFPKGTDISRLKEGSLIKADLGPEKQKNRRTYTDQHHWVETQIQAENLVIPNYPDIILKIKECPIYLPPEDPIDKLYYVTGSLYEPDSPHHLKEVTLKISKASLAHMAYDDEMSIKAIDPWRVHPRPKKSWEQLPHLVTISNDDVMTFHAVEMDDDGKNGLVHGIVTATIFDAQAFVMEAKDYYPESISSHAGGNPGIDLRVRFTDGPYANVVRPIDISLAFNAAVPKPGDIVKIQDAQRWYSGDMAGCIGATYKEIEDETFRRMRALRLG